MFVGAQGPYWRRVTKAEAVSAELDATLDLASNSYTGLYYCDLVYKNSLTVCLSSLQANGGPHRII